ncbi:ABC-ATPase domain-containing protein [Evansella tamaricis]|uniref:ABC-ATPase domain-containing protein n=1 Tax=Evansella tamaricis TaxID=2069301 RepID=A0ABS6JCK2_9BACI|nr:ABC-ATPase domain-containing protein [Evansella tamaricis]MBU9711402.1 ABC-ATPase domain-containing protein [Evansella tamaricis]
MKKLKQKLEQLDGKGYKGFKSIQGNYSGAFYTLFIDYVQGDPFASPSRIRVFIPLEKTDLNGEHFSTAHRKIAVENFFGKGVAQHLGKVQNSVKGTGKSGRVFIDASGQAILKRSAVKLSEKGIEFRLSVGLPARGRTILGKEADKLLCDYIPKVIQQGITNYNPQELKETIRLADDQQTIRHFLMKNGIISFIANHSILPRESGISQRPLRKNNVIPFKSPKEFEITIPLSDGREITGMGIRKGITLIVGGGFHGKSTVLQAIERGVYNHCLGDGREYVLTDETAMKIRSEDGRSVHEVDISPFISNLPFNKNTMKFSTEDASGSTSQAANIMEALEMNSRLLLIDEDTSATNFMIRDGRMQKLVKKDKEPITPFIDRVQQLYTEKNISSILVIGGSGDYFDVADHVIMMDEYKPYDRTEEAKKIAMEVSRERSIPETGGEFGLIQERALHRRKLLQKLDRKEKVDSKGLNTILIGRDQIQLHGVEQLIDSSQTRAIGYMLKILMQETDGSLTIMESINRLYKQMEVDGLDAISPYKGQHPGDLALPRINEVAAAINRIRY